MKKCISKEFINFLIYFKRLIENTNDPDGFHVSNAENEEQEYPEMTITVTDEPMDDDDLPLLETNGNYIIYCREMLNIAESFSSKQFGDMVSHHW